MAGAIINVNVYLIDFCKSASADDILDYLLIGPWQILLTAGFLILTEQHETATFKLKCQNVLCFIPEYYFLNQF